MNGFSPLALLVVIAVLTACAGLAEWVRVRRRRRILRRLAQSWQMHYTPRDRFGIAPRIARHIPTPGAAGVRVTDLIYAQRGDRYQYLFTAEYSVGTVGGLSRRFAVVAFSEPRDATQDVSTIEPHIAPEDLSLAQQYEHLHPKLTGGAALEPERQT